MSWSVRVIGSDREKVKNQVLQEMVKYAQSSSHEKIADAIGEMIDCFPDHNKNLALDVETNGHIDSNGYGNATVKITVIPKSYFADNNTE